VIFDFGFLILDLEWSGFTAASWDLTIQIQNQKSKIKNPSG
jgi:hypothetical protein